MVKTARRWTARSYIADNEITIGGFLYSFNVSRIHDVEILECLTI